MAVRIEHVALYVRDLEGARDFFASYLGGRAGACYHNQVTGFRSYFLEFDGGARLEIMTRQELADDTGGPLRTGYVHAAFSLGSREAVDELTARLRGDGYEVLAGPRITGDGYYESVVAGVEGILLELTM